MAEDQEQIPHLLETAVEASTHIKEQIRSGVDPTSIDGYLGRGTHGRAYHVHGIVVKLFDLDSRSEIEDEVARLSKVKGVSHTVQLVGASVEDRLVASQLLPGRNIMDIPRGTVPQYADMHIVGLINTIQAINERGLIIDPKPGNFLYDETEGFSVLDPIDQFPEYPASLAEQIMGLRHMLTYEGPYDPNNTKEESLARERRSYQTTIRLVTVVRNNFPALYEEIKQKDTELIQQWGEQGGFIKEGTGENDPEIKNMKAQLQELGLSSARSSGDVGL